MSLILTNYTGYSTGSNFFSRKRDKKLTISLYLSVPSELVVICQPNFGEMPSPPGLAALPRGLQGAIYPHTNPVSWFISLLQIPQGLPMHQGPICPASLTCWPPGNYPGSQPSSVPMPAPLLFILSFKCGLLWLATKQGSPSPPPWGTASSCTVPSETVWRPEEYRTTGAQRGCLSHCRGPGELSPSWLFTGAEAVESRSYQFKGHHH